MLTQSNAAKAKLEKLKQEMVTMKINEDVENITPGRIEQAQRGRGFVLNLTMGNNNGC